MDVSSAAIRNQRGRTHTRTAYPAGAATSSVPAHHSTFYVPVSAGRNDINMESGAPPFDAGDALAEPSAAVRGSSHANASNGADDNRRLAGCRAAPLPMVDASREASQALGCHNLPGVIATGPLPAAATASPGLLARSAGCGPARPDSATAGGQRSQRQAPRLGATPMASAAQSRPASAQSIAVVPAAPSRPQSGARLPGSSQLPPLPGRWAGATVSPRPPQPEQQHQLQQLQQQPVQLQALRTPRGIATVRAAASLTAPRAPSPRLAAAFSADNDASEGQAGPYSTCPGAGSAGGDVEAPSPPEPPPCAKPAPEGTECRICLSAECPEDLVAPCACAGTVKYAHLACLTEWAGNRTALVCELCATVYKEPYRSVLCKALLKPPSLRVGYSQGGSFASRPINGSFGSRGPSSATVQRQRSLESPEEQRRALRRKWIQLGVFFCLVAGVILLTVFIQRRDIDSIWLLLLWRVLLVVVPLAIVARVLNVCRFFRRS